MFHLLKQAILHKNFLNLSTNCTSTYPIEPLFGYLLINQFYIFPFYLLGINGILQNFLLIQTLISTNFLQHWSIVYKLIYSFMNFILSLCLMINIFLNRDYFRILTLICLILNSNSIWILTILVFERMLMQLFPFKFYGMTSKHALFISILILSSVTLSYFLSIYYSSISLLIIFFHLIIPALLHFISFLLTFICIIQRKCYLAEYSINSMDFIRICWNHSQFFLAPVFMMICLVIAIISIHWCFLLVFNLVFFFPQMISFVILVLPSKTIMNKFRTRSPCGHLMIKLHL